jgi:hypothetical protein
MSDRAIVSCVLFRAPTVRTSKYGNHYALATIRSGSGDAVRWWECFAFVENLIEEITALVDGEPVAVAGEFDCELDTPAAGESRLSWKIVADAVLSARRKPKPRQTKTMEPRSPAAAPSLFEEEGRRDSDDSNPF